MISTFVIKRTRTNICLLIITIICSLYFIKLKYSSNGFTNLNDKVNRREYNIFRTLKNNQVVLLDYNILKNIKFINNNNVEDFKKYAYSTNSIKLLISFGIHSEHVSKLNKVNF